MGGAITLFTKFPNSKNRPSVFSMSQIMEIAASFFVVGGASPNRCNGLEVKRSGLYHMLFL